MLALLLQCCQRGLHSALPWTTSHTTAKLMGLLLRCVTPAVGYHASNATANGASVGAVQ